MDEAYQILQYLPNRFKQRDEQEYIEFLWDAFESNYQNEKYQFAFIAYHMLFMSYVYFTIWQIKSVRADDFDKIKLGFNNNFGQAQNPFGFSTENESKVFNLLKYLCNSHSDVEALIGQYKRLVKERNDIAHASGNMPFRTESYLQSRLNDIIRYVAEIQEFSKPVIEECFTKFLIESQDEEERQYSIIEEQIKEVLIHEHYLSQKDLEICLDFDITTLSDQENYPEIERVFETLRNEYAEQTA